MRWNQLGYFAALTGKVGTGKTYIMALLGLRALRRGEPVFCAPGIWLDVRHIPDLADTPTFESVADYAKVAATLSGAVIVHYNDPLEVLDVWVRCGTVLWDELGATVNNRESIYWPFELTLKLIDLRKTHLNIFASVQDDEMSDKNVRRFYNTVFKCREVHLPLLGLFKPSWKRPKMDCPWPHCHKNHAIMSNGDGWGWATVYRLHDVDPQYTQNKEKHRSRGNLWVPFSLDIAKSYTSAESVQKKALEAYNRARANYEKKRRD
jgi:hypothetical protein